MRLWQLNYRFIQLKFVNFLLSTIFLTISLIATNYMASEIGKNLRTHKAISPLDETNYIFFQQENRIALEGVLESVSGEEFEITEYDSYENLLGDTVKKLKGVSSVSGVDLYSADTSETESGYIILRKLSPQLSEALEIPLKKGEWCNSSDGNTIEAVISNDSGKYSVGDRIDIKIDDRVYELLITGILEAPALEFRLSSAGDEMCSLDFLYPYDESANEQPLIYISPSWECPHEAQTDDGRIIFFDDNLSDNP